VIAHQLQHIIVTLNDSYLINHAISQQITSSQEEENNQPSKCGGCGQNGHDCRNCPVNPRSARPQRIQEEVVVGTAVGGPPNPLFMPTFA
jgi:6-phosphogluconolactonase/glucosamine-6-phosphate isomerase/deaminase